MEKAKEIVNDPVKLEAALKQAWEKLDAKKEGFITFEVLRAGLKEQAKALGIPEREPTPEEKEKTRKIADPEGTGKVNFENFVKLMKAGIEQMKAAGKF